ncbi:urea transporter [Caballeronia sordidicola]|jgi:urea transporter|uniref:Eukaryotic-type low-affinity urea transporter n=1 Tax=Caballeronia sordidicola TaxID=196367 RepID=A0A226WSN8_CABSO|nr:urea transporter [Caballeronia sordidicola]OXC74172.1 Eukaryotic-type low-affinity urea transporter [Caballeronia sordidicola]
MSRPIRFYHRQLSALTMPIAIRVDTEATMQIRSFARSMGQIVLQRNAATGWILVLALLCFNPRLACALLIGTLTGNVLAHIFDDHGSPATRNDLHGFNGGLAALAAFTFIHDDSRATAVAILAAVLATGLSGRLTRALSRWNLAAYSSPAVLVTWAWLPIFADQSFTTAAARGNAAASADSGVGLLFSVAPAYLRPCLEGIVAGLAPITFAAGPAAGALILVGLLVAKPSRAAWALGGSALGLALCTAFGASASVLQSGACGFNPALAALATCRFGVKAALSAIVLTLLIELAASAAGIPALTAPFVLASWFVQLLEQRFNARANHGDAHVAHPQN